MKNYKYGLILLIVLLQGCNPFEANNSHSETGIADDGLIINFREHHKDNEGSDPELFLEFKTKKIFGCVNYTIENEKLKTDTTIDIRLLGTSIGSVCLTAIGPATARIPFADVEGKMKLVIRDGDFKDWYEIQVTQEKVDITPIFVTFSETGYKRYYRKPVNSFHFKCRTKDTMAHLCQDFHDLLINELEIEKFEFPDDGYNPYISANSQTRRFQASKYYIYNMVDEFHRAGELLESFTHEKIGDTQGNSLSIYNWQNTGYRSWTFQNQ